MKQDRNGVRTAQDLERKYNLSSISLIKKAVEQTEVGLTKVNAELEDFANATLNTIEDLQDQIDGNITTFYYSGVPTLSNLPVSSWSESEYNTHIGDLYYDKNTGYAYRFYLDSSTNQYGWIRLTDVDVVQALAIANAASDTADSKRRVFTETPAPPYDNGDLWINNEEIYICQISKDSTQQYSSDDFIIATKYTDNTLANQVDERLTVVSGRVTTVEKGVDELSAQMEENRYYVDENGNKVLISEQINRITANVNGLTNSMTTVGGNNIFRNTGFWYNDSEYENIFKNNFTYGNYLLDTDNTIVKLESNFLSPYILGEYIEIDSSSLYIMKIPSLNYIASGERVNYSTYLVEFDEQYNVQKNNGEMIKHTLVSGENELSFQHTTKYVRMYIKKDIVKKNLELGDDLSHKFLYTSFPEDLYLQIDELPETEKYIIQGNNSSIEIHKSGDQREILIRKDDYENKIYNTLKIFSDFIVFNLPKAYVDCEFGEIISIDNSNFADYIKYDNQETLTKNEASFLFKSVTLKKSEYKDYEYWNGPVKRTTNDSSTNGVSLLVQNGELYQEQNVPNGEYSVSFKYQKLKRFANASVVINDMEYPLDSLSTKFFYTGEVDSTTGDYITQPLIVSTGSIKVTFKSDTDDAVEIYDLMVNIGRTKFIYSQNENETTTDTVKISKGITITSTNMETVFKANANGIRILTLAGNVVAYFTDKGLSTKELIVENEAQIVKTLWQEVGDQTWITRI